MKNFMMGFCLFVIGIMALLTIFMLEGKTIRSKEIKTGLAQAMESSLLYHMRMEDAKSQNETKDANQQGESNTANVESSPVESTKEELLADMTESFIVNVESDSTVTINVMGLDEEKGVASLKINEKFQNILGKRSEVTTQRTVLYNQVKEEETPTYTIRFYLSKEDMIAHKDSYKTYQILESNAMRLPKEPSNPTNKDKKFTSWVDKNDYESDFSQPVTQDMDFYAVWE